MFRWDAVDRPTSTDLGGQNVLITFEMATRCKRRTTRTEREFSVVGFSFTYVQKIFSGSLKAWVETTRTNAARRRRKPRPRRSALRRPVYESIVLLDIEGGARNVSESAACSRALMIAVDRLVR